MENDYEKRLERAETPLELLAVFGSMLLASGKTVAADWGLINENPTYKKLPKDTKLFINCESYVIKKSQQDGEKDLVELANEVPYEGEWIFAPEDSKWYHISEAHNEEFFESGGCKLSTTSGGMPIKIKGDRVFHYHTHPKKGSDHNLNYLLSELSSKLGCRKNEKAVLEVILSLYTQLQLCFPSSADISSYIFFKREITGGDGGDIFEGRIASPLGITTVEIQENVDVVALSYKEICRPSTRIINDKIIEPLKRADGGNAIRIYGENIFDSINKEMKGKIRLRFCPSDAYYSMSGRKLELKGNKH